MEKTCPSFKTCTNLLAENETLFLGVRRKRNYRIKVEFRNFSKNEAYSEKPYELETVKFNL